MPAQYAKLQQLIGSSLAEGKHFYQTCRAGLQSAYVPPHLSVDDLIDDALEKLSLGQLGKKSTFPKTQDEVISWVVERAKTTIASASRTRRRRGPAPVPFEEVLQQASEEGQTVQSFSDSQLALLDKLEAVLSARLAALQWMTKSSDALTSEVELT